MSQGYNLATFLGFLTWSEKDNYFVYCSHLWTVSFEIATFNLLGYSSMSCGSCTKSSFLKRERIQKPLSSSSSHTLDYVGIKVKPKTSRLQSKSLHLLLIYRNKDFSVFLCCLSHFTRISGARELCWFGLRVKKQNKGHN